MKNILILGISVFLLLLISGCSAASTWEKTKDVSSEAWEDTKDGSKKAWDATK